MDRVPWPFSPVCTAKSYKLQGFEEQIIRTAMGSTADVTESRHVVCWDFFLSTSGK